MDMLHAGDKAKIRTTGTVFIHYGGASTGYTLYVLLFRCL